MTVIIKYFYITVYIRKIRKERKKKAEMQDLLERKKIFL